jgi:hypothetical protein
MHCTAKLGEQQKECSRQADRREVGNAPPRSNAIVNTYNRVRKIFSIQQTIELNALKQSISGGRIV